jgi:glycosyltransferase involved in cell wall biosynthesis
VPQFKDYGYYYDANNFDMAAEKIEQIVEHHGSNVETYKTMIEQLAWRFSIYNPENIDAWRKLAFEKV